LVEVRVTRLTSAATVFERRMRRRGVRVGLLVVGWVWGFIGFVVLIVFSWGE